MSDCDCKEQLGVGHFSFCSEGKDEKIKQMEKRIAALEAENAKLREATRWRVTADEPPTGQQRVLAQESGGDWISTVMQISVRNYPELYPYWQPLPAPYTQDDAKQEGEA